MEGTASASPLSGTPRTRVSRIAPLPPSGRVGVYIRSVVIGGGEPEGRVKEDLTNVLVFAGAA